MNLRIAAAALLILYPSTMALSQTPKHPEVDPFNVPDELRTCLKTEPGLQINGNLNPFYISGDYDGDGITDFAVQVQDKTGAKHGILFCFGRGEKTLLGVGGPILWQRRSGGLDEEWPFDSWTLVRKGSKRLPTHPEIKSDALALILSEVSTGLLYWDGRKFRWWQQPEE